MGRRVLVLGVGGSFAAMQGEGVHGSCISRSSSVTLAIRCQFYKVEFVSSFLENVRAGLFLKLFE